uniref:Uncharacterized protein n=1 Tax=Tetranychus urticae TaxID=32264 RepID=T1L1G9_TETUR
MHLHADVNIVSSLDWFLKIFG